MTQQSNLFSVRLISKRMVLFALSAALVLGSLLQLLGASAGAAELSSRRVTISDSKASATGVSYAFAFTLPSTTAVQSMIFEFCTTPQGACTHPTAMDNNYTLAATNGTQTFSEATAFTEFSGADAGACDDHNNGTPANSTEYCVTRTDTDAETAAAKAITLDTITNSSTLASVYVRIKVYSDTAFATEVHTGTVAAAIVRQLTISGRVQERLVFCVFTLDDAAATPADCGVAPTTTSIDIGVIDNSTIVYSPVDNSPPASLGNDVYGAMQVNTNAQSGVALTYFPEAAGSGTNELRSFRVTGSTCNASGSDLTDQCFQDAAAGGTTLTAGTERFGMQIPCIDQTAGSTTGLGAGGTGSGTGGTFNTAYSNTDDTVTSAANCDSTDVGVKFAWNDSGTAAALVSSTGVVEDEVVKLRFGATASATTPTGAYTVVTTFIATPTF